MISNKFNQRLYNDPSSRFFIFFKRKFGFLKSWFTLAIVRTFLLDGDEKAADTHTYLTIVIVVVVVV